MAKTCFHCQTGDPFPGSSGEDKLLDTGSISTSFEGGRSGIEFRSIKFDSSGVVRLSITIAAPSPAPAVAKTGAGKKAKDASKKKAGAKKSTAEANKPPK